MSGKILIDEDEPAIDVEDPPFEASHVVMRTDVCLADEFNVIDFLGRGKYGEVKRCVEFSTGREFAAKFIATPKPQDRKDVEHEVHIMTKLHHRRLVQLYDAFDATREMCLVIEIVYGGELFDRVVKEDFLLTERACICFIRQICEGVEYMHSRNIVHLDLKPENIMCLSKSGNRVKIIDFGLAREFDPTKDNRLMHGTPEFMAPEVVLFDPIDFATDMWSIGVMCYVLLSGLSPFMGHTDTDTLCNVSSGKYDFSAREFDNVSLAAKQFITLLLQTEKRRRITASECLKNVWLKKPSPPPSPSLQASKARLRHLVYRRKWQKAIYAIIALRRMGADLNSNQSSSNRQLLNGKNRNAAADPFFCDSSRPVKQYLPLQSVHQKTPMQDSLAVGANNNHTIPATNNIVDSFKPGSSLKPLTGAECKQNAASTRQIPSEERHSNNIASSTLVDSKVSPHGWKARLGLTKGSKHPVEVPALHETSSLCDNPATQSNTAMSELGASASTCDAAFRKKSSSTPLFSFHLPKSKVENKSPNKPSNAKVMSSVGDVKLQSNGHLKSNGPIPSVKTNTANASQMKTPAMPTKESFQMASTEANEGFDFEKQYELPSTECPWLSVASNKRDTGSSIVPDDQTQYNTFNESDCRNGFDGFNEISSSAREQATPAGALASPPARRILLRDRIKFFNKKI